MHHTLKPTMTSFFPGLAIVVHFMQNEVHSSVLQTLFLVRKQRNFINGQNIGFILFLFSLDIN